MALSCVISEIVSVEKYRDLEIPVKSQSTSLKGTPLYRLCIIVWFPIMFYSNWP